jgi:hypothetical protein
VAAVTPADAAHAAAATTLVLEGLLGATIEQARANPTKALHEALAALGEALARVRFAAAVLAQEAQR